MLFTESVRIAVNALFANKLRSLLTMLGIIIVGAIVGSEWSHWTWDDKYKDEEEESDREW